MVATLAQHIQARNDQDLLERVIAAAERLDVPGANMWASSTMGRIVSADIGETTIADVHAYAVATYTPEPRPGANPAAVTDEQILEAVQATLAEDLMPSTPPTP